MVPTLEVSFLTSVKVFRNPLTDYPGGDSGPMVILNLSKLIIKINHLSDYDHKRQEKKM